MRFGVDDQLYLVTTPRPSSELGDICSTVTLRQLELQFRGGLTSDDHPTLFSTREEAEAEAKRRLLAQRVSRSLLRETQAGAIEGADQLRILDKTGATLFGAGI